MENEVSRWGARCKLLQCSRRISALERKQTDLGGAKRCFVGRLRAGLEEADAGVGLIAAASAGRVQAESTRQASGDEHSARRAGHGACESGAPFVFPCGEVERTASGVPISRARLGGWVEGRSEGGLEGWRAGVRLCRRRVMALAAEGLAAIPGNPPAVTLTNSIHPQSRILITGSSVTLHAVRRNRKYTTAALRRVDDWHSPCSPKTPSSPHPQKHWPSNR